MALIEEFERSGNWLFKYRSYVPLLLFPCAALTIAFSDSHYGFGSQSWYIFCLIVTLSGQFVRAKVIGHTPAGTSGRNTQEQVAETVNTTGMYSLVRHPLYLGNFLMMAGPFLLIGNLSFFMGASLFYWLYYERIMFAEEAFLRKKFGESYSAWAATVPPFLPKTLKWATPNLPFSVKNILKREYSGILSMGITFAFINFLQNLVYKGIYHLDLFWQMLLFVSLIICLTLRFLKKRTNILEVAGR